MKTEAGKEPRSAEDTEMLSEYDFSKMNLVQGKTHDRLQKHRRTRVLSASLAEKFPDSESVNVALEELIRLKRESQ